MNIENYINLAKAKNNISSNNKLGKCLGMTGGAISLFLNGKSMPSPETIIKLGQLAGLDEKKVFLDYLSEKYKDLKETKKVIDDFKNLTAIL